MERTSYAGHINMSPPPASVRVNTFVSHSSIDILSKVFISAELAFGLNRFYVFGKNKSIYVVLTFVYALVFKCLLFFLIYWFRKPFYSQIIAIIKTVQYIFICIFSYCIRKRLRRYYDELDKFDTEVGCRPKTIWGSIRIIAQLCVTIVYIIAVYFIYPSIGFVLALPLHFTTAFECHYYGHLLNLLIPRIRLINYCLESSLSTDEILKSSNSNEFNFYGNNINNNVHGNMGKFMDLYHTVIRSHTLLIDAIKWQLLVIITTAFAFTLVLSYYIANSLLNDEKNTLFTLSCIGMLTAEMIPLFAPCMCCDQIRAEVRRLRELLASILYENRLEKPCRSVTRALLALSEARDLSFSLLRVVDISISLPFTFSGLLVTYLIILLQFQKVNTTVG